MSERVRRAKKFRPGHQITDIHDLVHSILVGCWIYWPDQTRPTHPQFMLMLSLETLKKAVEGGRCWIAVPVEPESGAAG